MISFRNWSLDNSLCVRAGTREAWEYLNSRVMNMIMSAAIQQWLSSAEVASDIVAKLVASPAVEIWHNQRSCQLV